MIAKIDDSSMESGNVEDGVPVYAIPEVPVTAERKPWFNDKQSELPHPGKLFAHNCNLNAQFCSLRNTQR